MEIKDELTHELSKFTPTIINEIAKESKELCVKQSIFNILYHVDELDIKIRQKRSFVECLMSELAKIGEDELGKIPREWFREA